MSMPVTAVDASVTAQVTRRWQEIDPLLPAPESVLSVSADHLVLAESDGSQVAAATCEHWEGSADSLDLTWGAARRFLLDAQVGGPDVGSSLDWLLSRWREHLDGVPGAGETDSAAVLTWPSRDICGVKSLLRRGFAPLAVIAARRPGNLTTTTAAGQDSGAAESAGVTIRRASPADIDDVVRLGLDVIRYDAQVSGVKERPGTADALRREIAEMLAAQDPWIWLAEQNSRPIGMLAAEQPATAQWIAPMVRAAPVAYLLLMGVAADQRGAGIGAAMAARLHREIDAAGIAVTLLHYAQVNPLSAPFWSQQGYRPLWTVWEAAPALAFR
jgi:GNAT superfamily N-acetyltransferase